MSFRIRPDRELGEATRAVIDAQLDAALGRLSAPLTDKDVHEARKHGKRVRAVLRLLRPSFTRGRTRTVSRPVRDGARHLSSLRDARVMRDVLTGFDPDLLRHVSVGLPELPPEGQREDARRAARAGFTEGRAQLDALPWERLTLDGLRLGALRRWRAATHGHAEAAVSPDAETLHEWRKDVKALGYQVKALSALWPEVLPPLDSALSELGATLGDHHDLAVLRGVLRRVDGLDPGVFDGLDARESELARLALEQGGAVFDGPEPAVLRALDPHG